MPALAESLSNRHEGVDIAVAADRDEEKMW